MLVWRPKLARFLIFKSSASLLPSKIVLIHVMTLLDDIIELLKAPLTSLPLPKKQKLFVNDWKRYCLELPCSCK